MPDLAALQTRVAESLLSGCYDAIAADGLVAPLGAEEVLELHRGTALGGLINALRLSYPTVDTLVGAAFFDQAAQAFVQAQPPSSPCLSGYGAGFAEFLGAYDPASSLPYLPDVARLDFAIEAVAGEALGQDGLQLDFGGSMLTLDASLRVLELDYPAAAIRDAIVDDETALAGIEVTPRHHALALWRVPDGAALRRLSPISAAFLNAVLGGRDVAGDDIAAMLGGGDAAALQSDVLAAPFAHLALVRPTLAEGTP